MTCPICDQKPMNCDCTPRERAMYMELQELEGRPVVVLTDAEREAIVRAWHALLKLAAFEKPMIEVHLADARTINGLLERTKNG